MHARSRLAVLVAGTLGLSAALVGSGTLSSANASGPTAQPAGQLVLTTLTGSSTGDAWSFGSVTQPVGAVPGTCTLTPTTGPLVSLSATSGVPAFATHMIGVNGAPWPNYQCARINKYSGYPGQSLTLSLRNTGDGALHDPVFGSLMASAATFDLEVTDNSKLKAELLVGSTVVGTASLYADDNRYPTTVPSGTTYCHLSSSWIRDTYGKKDNCTWSIATGTDFDGIRLTAVAGSFSVEGGGDWGADAAQHRTSFSLVKYFDGSLDCSASNVATVVGNGEVSGVDVTRLDNGAPTGQTPDPCVAVPYTLDASGSDATFHKPDVAGQGAAQFAIAFSRQFTDGSYPAPPVAVNWEDGGADLTLALCPVGLIGGVGADHLPTSVDYAAIPTDMSPVAGTQFACIYQPTSAYDNGSGTLSTTDWIYVTGDILLTTKR